MTTFPPDFWTKPQPGGLAGLCIGAVIGYALWLYYNPLNGSLVSFEYQISKVISYFAAGIGALIGLIVGSLVTFYFGN